MVEIELSLILSYEIERYVLNMYCNKAIRELVSINKFGQSSYYLS